MTSVAIRALGRPARPRAPWARRTLAPVLVATLLVPGAFVDAAGATGTACATEEPSTDAEGRHVIDSPAKLAWISGVDLDADRDRQVDDAADDAALTARLGHDYVQTTDVDLAGCEWLPIGQMRTSDLSATPPFDGTYDGGGNAIRGLTIVARTGILTGQRDFLGLFARTGTSGVAISDLRVVDASLSADSGQLRYAGILIGQTSNPLTVEDVHVSGTIADVNVETGGLIGDLGDHLGDVSRGPVLIARSSATVTITPGPFSSDGSRVGGLVGEVNPRSADTRIVDSTVSGTVTTRSSANATGGLVGIAYSGSPTADAVLTVERSSADVTVAGRGEVGGLIGEARVVVVKDSSATGDVSGTGYAVGGLIGVLAGAALVERSFATGDATTTEEWAGGLIGSTSERDGLGPTVRHVYATGTVTEGTDDWLPRSGGLIGQMATGSLSDAFTTSTLVTADGVTAGFAGAGIGGAVGAAGSGATIARVLARATVGSTADPAGVGAFLGLVPDADVVSASFYARAINGAMPGIGTGAAGAGRNAGYVTGGSDAELRAIATFTDAGWDVVDGWAEFDPTATPARVWGICPDLGGGFPFLLWQYSADEVPVACGGTLAATGATTSDPGPDLTCAPTTIAVGGTVTCTVSAGPADTDFVWRAAHNPAFAEGVVRTDADGAGTFTFIVPSAALGDTVTVELVAWTAPIPIGVVGAGPRPSSIPAGEGAASSGLRTSALLVLAALIVAGALASRRRAVGPLG